MDAPGRALERRAHGDPAHGLIGLSLRPLAAEIGTSDRMLIYHFTSRDALVSAVVAQTTLAGWPRADVGLFEVDEATVPAALREIRPRAVLLTNIFRD